MTKATETICTGWLAHHETCTTQCGAMRGLSQAKEKSFYHSFLSGSMVETLGV